MIPRWNSTVHSMNIFWTFRRRHLNWCTAGRVWIRAVFLCHASPVSQHFPNQLRRRGATFHPFGSNKGAAPCFFFPQMKFLPPSDYCSWRQTEAKLSWLTRAITGRTEVPYDGRPPRFSSGVVPIAPAVWVTVHRRERQPNRTRKRERKGKWLMRCNN